MSSIFDNDTIDEAPGVAGEMLVERGDLAAVSFHAKDIVNEKTRYLERKRLKPGTRVKVQIECEVIETAGGGLRFGNYKGRCDHD
ncbi:MAG TPA: hypothetical protein VLE97_01890 [Gaiellaceae bacterium]|nr:hypothetical protein [Gaiellaceae bacterium]